MIRPGDSIPNGWFWDGEQNVYHDGKGLFYVGDTWYDRPDLLAAQPFVPPAMTLQDKARVERQRLSTPWPKYREAWRHAKAYHWFSRYYVMVGWAIGLAMTARTFDTSDPNSDPFFVPIFWMASWPFSIWWVYYRYLRSVDKHKAFAFLAASYGVVAVGTHYAANGRRPASPEILTQQQRQQQAMFTGNVQHWQGVLAPQPQAQVPYTGPSYY